MKIHFQQQYFNNLNFTAGKKPPKLVSNCVQNDIASSENIGRILPETFAMGDIELKACEALKTIEKLQAEAFVQKKNLRYYYSAQDRFEYRELMQEKQRANSLFKRLAKKFGLDANSFESYIREKCDYNYYAPKIYKAKTLEELDKLKSRIEDKSVYIEIKKLLYELIDYRKTLIK